MKILTLGDPHGILPKNLDRIIKKNKIDLIVCVGDWAFTPEKPWAEESWKGVGRKFIDDSYKNSVNKVCSYGLPVLTLRGNMFMKESKPKADKYLRKNKNLINKFTGKYKINGQNFVFFDISYELFTLRDEHKGEFFRNRMLKNKRREIKLDKLLKENPNSILITHNPPYGVVDKSYTGKHVGSKIILNAVKKHQPKLLLCGHIHEAKGRGKIGRTPVYNLGWHGDYAVFDITEKVKLVESNFLK